eukprot:904582_1
MAYPSLTTSRGPKLEDSRSLALVLQVYAPAVTIRVLYVLCCPRTHCLRNPQSWRVLRVLTEETEAEVIRTCESNVARGPNANGGGAIFDVADWDESVSDGDDHGWGLPKNEISEPESTPDTTESLATNLSGSCSITDSLPTIRGSQPICFDSFWICWGDEPSKQSSSPSDHSRAAALLDAYVRANPDDSGGALSAESKWAAEKYEKGGDAMMERFQKRISRAPTQCVRYCFGGDPLWCADSSNLEVQKCACGRERVFEMQLMPNLFNELKCSQLPKGTVFDWTTMSIFVCPDSCGSPGSYYEEVIIAQCT